MSLKKAIYVAFTLLLLLAALPSSAQDVRIVHSIEQQRDGLYTANVMITNMTSTTIPTWTMSFRLDTYVESIQHAGWSEFQNAFTVDGRGWTKKILPGDVVWFTISGLSYNGTVEIPRNCFFNGSACVIESAPQPNIRRAQPSEMIVSAWIQESDVTTYSGYILVQNTTDYAFAPLWDLKFSTPSLIVEMKEVLWNRSGSDYQVYGYAHTDSIGAHDFALIPFRGVHTGTPSLPTNCRLNGTACSFVPPDHLIETPWMNVDFKMVEMSDTIWEGYIRIANPTKKELSSWTLRFDLPMTITEMDGMNWERSGTQYTVRPEFGRGRILEESEYTFRIAGTWVDQIQEPENCTVNARPCVLNVEIQQDVVSDTTTTGGGTGGTGGGGTGGGGTGGGSTVTCDNPGTGAFVLPTIDFRFLNLSLLTGTFISVVYITNTGTAAIKNWTWEFKLVTDMVVTSAGSATFVNNAGNFRILPVASNSCILPGQTISFTMTGTHKGDFDKPLGCNFNGLICTLSPRMFSTDDEEEIEIPETVTLHGAYPNPFNPQATITFEVNQTQAVRVELWDTLGRMQQLLYSGQAYSGSNTSVQIDGSALTSGIYFVRLVPQNGEMQVQKVILQK